jgi:hypothetical protein
MRILPFVRRHPISILGLLIAAFGAWLWANRSEPAPPRAESNQAFVPRIPPPLAPPQKKLFPPAGSPGRPNPYDIGQALPKLKPGMTRAEVEELVGVPAPRDILPATVVDGKVRYRTTYEADLGAPSTVRPLRIPRPQLERDSHPNARTFVTLEFDATQPGHPLLDVLYSDPLF